MIRAGALRPGDAPLNCPVCQNPTECVSLVPLRMAVRRRPSLLGIPLGPAVVVSVVVGDRFCCQRCCCQFSVGPQGVFYHHAKAIPLTTVPAEPPPRAAENGPERPRAVLTSRPRV